MPHEKMRQSKSAEPISVLLLPSPALLLAEAEAQIKAKAPRLRTQQRGRVAKGKKGRLRAAWGLLRYLWGKTRAAETYSQGIAVCRPALRPRTARSFDRGSQVRRGEP